MAARGMGVFYERGCFGQPIRRRLLSSERDQLLDAYHAHHSALNRHTANALAEFNFCLFLDCHSYPAQRLPYELSPEGDRAGIVIGTDSVHTPSNIIELIRKEVERAGYSFALDVPFSGTVVPAKFLGDPRVLALMVEVNRELYMDEISTRKSPGSFEQVKIFLGSLVDKILLEVRAE